MSELLVLEVMTANLDRPAPGLDSRPTALKSPISSRFFASTLITGSPTAIASLTVSLMCANLRVAIRRARRPPASSCSPAGCTPLPSTTATRCDRRRQSPSPAAPGRLRAALRGPPQRRLRIAPRDRIHHSLQILPPAPAPARGSACAQDGGAPSPAPAAPQSPDRQDRAAPSTPSPGRPHPTDRPP